MFFLSFIVIVVVKNGQMFGKLCTFLFLKLHLKLNITPCELKQNQRNALKDK